MIPLTEWLRAAAEDIARVARERDNARADLDRYKRALAEQSHNIEQMIAELFPDEFPRYPEEWNANGTRCVGDHTPESMVDMLVGRYRDLKVQNERIARDRDQAMAALVDRYRDGPAPTDRHPIL